jgi:WD40 repeat protein
VSGAATMLTELPGNGQRLKLCMYSPDCAHLITSTINGEMKIWNSKNDYAFVRHLKGHVSMIRDMAFSPSGRYLATVAVEMSLRIWDVPDDFRLTCVWYGPVNQLGFISETALVLGESTGNRRTIEFDG